MLERIFLTPANASWRRRVMPEVGVATALIALAAVLVNAGAADAVGLTYVDAEGDPGFGPNLSPLSGVNPATSTDADNRWGFRAFGAGGTIWESGGQIEDAPEVSQRISGLAASASYDVYVAYWTDTSNWNIRAGFSSGNLQHFNRTGPGVGASTGAVAGQFASAAVWDTPPADNPTGTNDAQGLFREGATRWMLLGKIGATTANSNGEIDVFLDDLPAMGATVGGANRAWLDGLAYVPSGTPVFLEFTIDRDTGAIALSNPTDAAFSNIKSYSITSAAGTLDATQWTTISGHYDGGVGGDASLDNDVWAVTQPAMPLPISATQLAEAEDAGGSGGLSIGTGGGPVALGNAWIRSPIEDVVIQLTLMDDTLIEVRPAYSGAALKQGDFDGDGDVDLVDYTVLNANMETTLTQTLSVVETYMMGDLTGNKTVDFADFQAFRAAYDAANGAGSFAAHVPEPGTLAILGGAAAALALGIGRRVRVARRAAVVGLVVAGAAQAVAAPVVNWQKDPLLASTAPLTNEATDSPVLGDGATNNSAQTASLFAAFPVESLGVGEQLTLTGTATFLGANVNLDNFRWGLFKDDGAAPDTGGWLGFFGQSGNGPSGGTLWSKNPAGTSFAAVTFASTTANRGTILTTGVKPVDQAFDPNGVYEFSMTVGRYNSNNEVVVSGSFLGDSFTQVWNPVVESNTTRVTTSFDRVGLLSSGTVGAEQISFAGIDVSTSEINDALRLVVNTASGAVEIMNPTGDAYDLTYYRIASASGSLDMTEWDSLDDQEGANPVGAGWDESGGISTTLLSEGNLQSALSLAADGNVNLGAAFAAAGTQDLAFFVAGPDGVLRPGLVDYVSAPVPMPDLNMDGKVDIFDVAIVSNNWASAGTPGTVTGDANKDGVVDIFDVALISNNWNPGGGAAAVPEPAAWAIAFGLLPACCLVRRQRSR